MALAASWKPFVPATITTLRSANIGSPTATAEAGSRWVSIGFPSSYTSIAKIAPDRAFTCNEYFMSEPRPGDPEVPDSRRGALIGLGVVLLLIVAGLVLAHVLRNTAQVQDCVMSGRTNCAPIDTSSPESHGSN